VTHFVPVIAEKSEKKNFNEDRGLKIIQEAAEQSQRALLPTLGAMCKTADALNVCKEEGIESILVLDPTGEEKFNKNIVKDRETDGSPPAWHGWGMKPG
jgi:16S rRNA U1498 N3-methylase RsmE